MAVSPYWLNGIGANVLDPKELERSLRELASGPSMEFPHDITLALAACTRTTPPKGLDVKKALRAILPFNRELVADDLHV
jgi:hypothetical protein